MEEQETSQPQNNLIEFHLPPRVKDLTGQRFGKLVVQRFFGVKGRGKKAEWLCKCDCGVIKAVLAHALQTGNTISCGCGRGIRDNSSPRKDKVAVCNAHHSDRSNTEPEDDCKQRDSLQSSQGYAWRTDKPASPISNKKLEQHPNGLWKYPGTQPIPDKLLPAFYCPNYKKLRNF